MAHIRYRLPKLRASGDGETKILVKDFHIVLPVMPFLAVAISIRHGFRTDGASIPQSMRRYIGHPFDYVRLIAALVHDAIYATHLLPRILADWIYFVALRRCSRMPRAYAFAEFLALRGGGKAAWNEKTPQSIAEARKLVSCRFTATKGNK